MSSGTLCIQQTVMLDSPPELTLPCIAPSVPVMMVMLQGTVSHQHFITHHSSTSLSVSPLASSITAAITVEVNQLCGNMRHLLVCLCRLRRRSEKASSDLNDTSNVTSKSWLNEIVVVKYR